MESDRLSRTLLMITPPGASLKELERIVPAAGRGGVSHVLLRLPEASASSLYRIGTRLMELLAGSGVPLLVSDRIDVALALGARGIHLGQRSLPVERARAIVPDLLLGVSIHDAGQAIHAAAHGADYLVFGHVYATPSHPGEPGRGIDALREVVAAVDIPVIAIGGITRQNAGEVLAAGASGLAVISAISAADDPGVAARMLRTALDRTAETHLASRKETSCN